MPEQPIEEEPFWREQLSELITGLGWAVVDLQPWIFGLGLVQMRSPAACSALINHEPFEIQNNQFVRFARVAVGDYHRGVNGFRTGWLMFLGVHPDFRNDFDISNAVATFEKYHHWHRDDPLKARTLVYASFPSPQLVPRDMVFGDYDVVGGDRLSWTAACYVLTVYFADQMPADEDPMPLDGNPHPLPGELQPDPNNFVMPQFPEIGWNVIPNNNDNVQ